MLFVASPNDFIIVSDPIRIKVICSCCWKMSVYTKARKIDKSGKYEETVRDSACAWLHCKMSLNLNFNFFAGLPSAKGQCI